MPNNAGEAFYVDAFNEYLPTSWMPHQDGGQVPRGPAGGGVAIPGQDRGRGAWSTTRVTARTCASVWGTRSQRRRGPLDDIRIAGSDYRPREGALSAALLGP